MTEKKNLSLQEHTDALYKEAQKELKGVKASRDIYFIMLGIASICFLTTVSTSSTKENVYAFGILSSLFMLTQTSYLKAKENLENQVLGSIKNKEMGTKEYKENEVRYKSDFKLLNDGRKIHAQNILGYFISCTSLLAPAAGVITGKISWPTSLIASLRICSATNYWAKHNINHLNNRYKLNLNNIVKLKSLEKE